MESKKGKKTIKETEGKYESFKGTKQRKPE